MKRTTILADESLMLEVKHLARESGCTVTDIVQRALRTYLDAQRRPRSISCVGFASSGRGDIAARSEELLTERATRNEGW